MTTFTMTEVRRATLLSVEAGRVAYRPGAWLMDGEEIASWSARTLWELRRHGLIAADWGTAASDRQAESLAEEEKPLLGASIVELTDKGRDALTADDVVLDGRRDGTDSTV